MKQNHKSSKEPSQRQLRVGEQLRHIIAQTMQRGHLHSEVLLDAEQITVTEVRVSPDLKNATAYIIPLGGKNLDEILPALNQEAKTFQKEINAQSNLKFTPRITFKQDTTFDKVQRLDQILHEIHTGKDDD